METTEQDLLATQKALEEEVQNKVKEAMVDNFLRVNFVLMTNSNRVSICFFSEFSGKIRSRTEIYSSEFDQIEYSMVSRDASSEIKRIEERNRNFITNVWSNH